LEGKEGRRGKEIRMIGSGDDEDDCQFEGVSTVVVVTVMCRW
jgi:hypothetical protein